MASRRDDVVVGRVALVGRLQDVDRRLRLAVAQPRVGHHRVDRRRARLGAERDLPHAGGIAIAPERGERRAQIERRREELAARAGGDLQLRGRLIELPLGEEIDAAQERRDGLIAGAQRLERAGAVAPRARLGHGVLQRRPTASPTMSSSRATNVASEHRLPDRTSAAWPRTHWPPPCDAPPAPPSAHRRRARARRAATSTPTALPSRVTCARAHVAARRQRLRRHHPGRHPPRRLRPGASCAGSVVSARESGSSAISNVHGRAIERGRRVRVQLEVRAQPVADQVRLDAARSALPGAGMLPTIRSPNASASPAIFHAFTSRTTLPRRPSASTTPKRSE